MTYRGVRRRLGQRLAEHDWFEGTSVVLGGVFLVIALACVVAFAVALLSLGDAEPDISAESSVLSNSTQGTLEATRWFGMVVFAVLALITATVGWFLAGDAVRRTVRRARPRA